MIVDVITLNQCCDILNAQSSKSDVASGVNLWWMPFLSAAILLFVLPPTVGEEATDSVVLRAVGFGVAIYMAYLSSDERRNPGWYLFGLLVFLGYVIILILAACLSDWARIFSFWSAVIA